MGHTLLFILDKHLWYNTHRDIKECVLLQCELFRSCEKELSIVTNKDIVQAGTRVWAVSSGGSLTAAPFRMSFSESVALCYFLSQ